MAADFKAARGHVQQALKRNENMLRVTTMLKRPDATSKIDNVQSLLRSALSNIERSLSPPACDDLQKACAAVDEVKPFLPGYSKEGADLKAIISHGLTALDCPTG